MSDVRLSIVLIVRDPDDSPDRVVSALAGQASMDQVELIVVDGRETACNESDLSGNLNPRVIAAPGKNMPRLKAIGVEAAQGDHIAFLEPNGVPQEGWLADVQRAIHDQPDQCYGGGVTFGARETAINVAAYMFEYREFSRDRVQAQTTSILPGNNMVIPSAALRSTCSDILESEGLNKPFCQQRLIESGLTIALREGMTVIMAKEQRLFKFLARRFHYGRCFGGTRLVLSAPKQRMLYRIGAPAVSVLLLVKHIGGLSKQDLGQMGVGSFFTLISICFAWGVGEGVGYWFGRGKSCSKLY